MLNVIKTSIFNLYSKYFYDVPIKKGKYRIAQALNILFGYAIYNIDGIKLELNPIGHIDKALIYGKSYQYMVRQAIESSLSQGGCFLDIGANIGYFSLLAAKIPNVTVLSFEPSPREIIRLYRNIVLNKFTNIIVFPYGLAEKKSSMDLYIDGDYNSGRNSVIQLKHLKDKNSLTCNFLALDDVIAQEIIENIRVCKIDVEGYEFPVLLGMKNSIKFMKNTLFLVEISPTFYSQLGYKTEDIYNFFSTYGYHPKFGLNKNKNIQYDEIFSRL